MSTTQEQVDELRLFLKEKLDTIDIRLAAIEHTLYGPIAMDGRRLGDGLEDQVSDLGDRVSDLEWDR